MNDQDRYRRMVLTTSQFEATLNIQGRKLGHLNRNKYKTLFGQQQNNKVGNAASFDPKLKQSYKPPYYIDESEKWWK